MSQVAEKITLSPECMEAQAAARSYIKTITVAKNREERVRLAVTKPIIHSKDLKPLECALAELYASPHGRALANKIVNKINWLVGWYREASIDADKGIIKIKPMPEQWINIEFGKNSGTVNARFAFTVQEYVQKLQGKTDKKAVKALNQRMELNAAEIAAYKLDNIRSLYEDRDESNEEFSKLTKYINSLVKRNAKWKGGASELKLWQAIESLRDILGIQLEAEIVGSRTIKEYQRCMAQTARHDGVPNTPNK